MIRIKDIVAYLEQIAPLAYQEDYDNSGLVVGEADTPTAGVLISVDITEAVLQEAKTKGCNLIVAHHPLIFKPIYQLTGKDYVSRCITYAIKHELAIYILHTNLDNVAQGVNQQIAQNLGLQDLSILLPKPSTLSQLTTFVPPSATQAVLQALHQAGTGRIGNYTHCSFVTTGTGSFQPTPVASPYAGTPGQLEKAAEERVEVVFPTHLENAVLSALKSTHPYEEAAYYIHQLQNTDAEIGAGMIGTLPEPLPSEEFLQYLKTQMELVCIRHTAPVAHLIERVAVCGGSGSFLIRQALRKSADVLVTADMKYHDFFQAEGRLMIADIGHYESEVGVKLLIHTLLSEKFASIALLRCETVTNPIHYL